MVSQAMHYFAIIILDVQLANALIERVCEFMQKSLAVNSERKHREGQMWKSWHWLWKSGAREKRVGTAPAGPKKAFDFLFNST
jgi:hypothetical protein